MQSQENEKYKCYVLTHFGFGLINITFKIFMILTPVTDSRLNFFDIMHLLMNYFNVVGSKLEEEGKRTCLELARYLNPRAFHAVYSRRWIIGFKNF